MTQKFPLFGNCLYALLVLSASSLWADKYFIGMAVPLSGEYRDRGSCYVKAAQIYCQQLNARGGINGVKLELIVKDDQNNPEAAKKVVQELAQDKRVLGIIGHHYSPSALASIKVCEQEGVVLISPYVSHPAFTQSSHWAFSMISNDIEEGKFIAAYAKEVLKLDNILILHADDNDFGTNLKNGFRGQAAKIGLKIADTLGFDPQAIPDDFVVSKVTETIKKAAGGVVVFCHSSPGMKLIEQLRKAGIKLPIVGPHSFTGAKFLEMKEEYTAGVYAVSPFLYEMGNEITVKFAEAYRTEFFELPNNHAPLAYDAVHCLVEAITDKGADRSAIRDYLANLDYHTSLEGASGGVLYFSKNRDLDRDFFVSEIKDGRFKVAYTQLKEPKEPYVLQQAEERVKKGALIKVADVYYHVIDVVFVGIDFLRLDDISTSKMTFQAEIFLWFKWMNPKLDTGDFYFMNGTADPANKIELLKENLSRPIKYRCYRVTWTYLANFELQQFPFDSQTLNISVAHKNLHSTHLMLALDSRHMTKNPVTEIPEEWQYDAKKMNTGLYRYDSTFGDPDYRTGKGYKSKVYFAVATVDIDLNRHFTSYIFTFFLPLGIIIVITLLIFGIPISDLGTRLSVAMTSLLSILVFQMTQRQVMPMVGYAMKSDYYFIISYAFLLSLIFVLVLSAALQRKQKAKAATLLDRLFVMAGIPVTVVLYLLVPWL